MLTYTLYVYIGQTGEGKEEKGRREEVERQIVNDKAYVKY